MVSKLCNENIKKIKDRQTREFIIIYQKIQIREVKQKQKEYIVEDLKYGKDKAYENSWKLIKIKIKR